MKFNYLIIGDSENKETEIQKKLKEKNVSFKAFYGSNQLNKRRYHFILSDKMEKDSLNNNFRQKVTYTDDDIDSSIDNAIDDFNNIKNKQFIALRDLQDNLIFVQEASIEKIIKGKNQCVISCKGNDIVVKEGLFYIFSHLFEKKDFRFNPFSYIERK